MNTSVELTNRQQVLALQDINLLNHFRAPACPSLIADHLGIAPNLMHYRVKRLVKLGILEGRGREGRRHLYQLRARIFTYPAYLLTSENHGYTRKLFDQLYAKLTSGNMDDLGDHVCVDFGDQEGSPPIPTAPSPSSLTVDTFNVPASRMEDLMESLREVLQAYSTESSSAKHTFALMYFKGEIND